MQTVKAAEGPQGTGSAGWCAHRMRESVLACLPASMSAPRRDRLLSNTHGGNDGLISYRGKYGGTPFFSLRDFSTLNKPMPNPNSNQTNVHEEKNWVCG